MSAALSFGHGANDAQKSMGVIAALLLATGHLDTLSVPLWVKLACGAALTLGTAMGGWRIVRTIGRRIFRLCADRRVRQPERLDGGDPPRLLPRRAGLHDAGRRLLGGRRRRRPAPLAPRPLERRALDRLRLAADPSGLGGARGDNAGDLEGE